MEAPGVPVGIQLLQHLARHGSTTEVRRSAQESLYLQHLQHLSEGVDETPPSPKGSYTGTS